MSDEPQHQGQDLLNAIMDRAMPPDVSRETSAERETETPPKNRPSSAYLYLLVLFGAAFLMLLLAYFVQQRNNKTTIDGLQDSWNLSRGELVEENHLLTEKNEELEVLMAALENQLDRANKDIDALKEQLITSQTLCGTEASYARAASCLWYLQQFMEAKDYPMAAAVMCFSASNYKKLYGDNPAQLKQYETYQQELIDRGYAEEIAPGSCAFTQQWDPSQSDDMAAMSILWCAMDAHFLNRYDEAAGQYLYLYALGDPDSGYQERVERLASDFTLQQFQDLKDVLVKAGTLSVAEDGRMTQGPGFHPDILYGLPFVPPPDVLSKIPLS